MAAGKYSFIIEQGATTNFQINWNDESGSAVDLSGYQARMQIRPGVESSDVFLSLSSSLDAAEVIGLYDRRLNPDLYRTYQLNYALSTGSTYNEAVMWSVNNS